MFTNDSINYRTSEQAVGEQKLAENELAEEVDTANIRVEEINNELSSIHEQLGEAKVCAISLMVCHAYLQVFKAC